MSFFYFYLYILVHPYLALWWRSFPNTGRQSWEAMIPVYNYFVAFKVFCKKPWWVLLLAFPGVHLVMLASLNVSYIRRFGYFTLLDTVQGIFFPYIIFAKIASSGDQMIPETNWANSKEVGEREWGDHLALFLALPVIGHVIALAIAAVTRQKPGTKSKVKEWGDSIIFALVAASIIRTYVFEPFQIPTGSMERTLLVGDFLFVNKLAYGPKVPVTPLSYPLVHNTVPWINIKSYTTLEKGSYTRLPGFSNPKNNDVMVFNYPSGDTAVYDPRMPNGLMGHDYHGLLLSEAQHLWKSESSIYPKAFNAVKDSVIRSLAAQNQQVNSQSVDFENYIDQIATQYLIRIDGENFFKDIEKWKSKARYTFAEQKVTHQGAEIIEHYGLIYRPVDKRENYIKRCVGIPGDTIEIRDSKLFINNLPAFIAPNQNLLYIIKSAQTKMDTILTFNSLDELMEKYKLEYGDLALISSNSFTGIHMNQKTLKTLRAKYPNLKFELSTAPIVTEPSSYSVLQKFENLSMFPKDPMISNTVSNFQKIQIPYKGKIVDFTKENIAWYRRIITAYEGHTLEERKDGIYIDGKKTTKYKIEMDYYWLMGDNRYNSADSRVWGFVPEDHVVGKASMVWFSKSAEYGVRWERIFKLIK